MTRRTLERYARLALAWAALLSLAVPARATDDATLERKIEARLQKARNQGRSDVEVSVANGRATLSGVATTLDAQREALRAARKETEDVEDRIRLQLAERPDGAVLRDAERAILRYPRYTVFDSVGLAVEAGVATLFGSVREPYRKQELEQRVAEVPGVAAIRNQIEVQPVSLGDDRLRAELVRSIYGHDLFNSYAHWADPPIHIVVDHGHVTLSGYVRSELERQLAGSIARGTLAFGVDNQVRLESEKRAEPGRAGVD